MPDTLVARTRRAEIESRIGVEPIDDLLARRRDLVEKHAELAAVFGAFGTFEHQRKTELALISARLRAEYTAAGVKVTEAALESGAHADPGYIAFITKATEQRAAWARIENELESIDALIRRDQSLMHFLAAESRLTP